MAPPDNSLRPNLIWLPEVDSDGRRLHPQIEEVVYSRQSDLARYRANELGDEAQIATLIEEAAYRASEVAFERTLQDPVSYLFRTYSNLVDITLRKTIRSFGLEEQVLSYLARTGDSENEILTKLTRRQILECMDEKGRELWERNLLGYTVGELAAQEGQSGDYVGKRLRRAMQGALRRLLLREKSAKKQS
ncbi:MAG: hypothetical protein ACJ746_15565 [Bryobacteraceae bacterium]